MQGIQKIRAWLAPPVFPGDEEKTGRARIFNRVGLYLLVTLLICAGLFVPLFVQRKLESWGLLLLLFGIYFVARYFLARGYVDLAAQVVVSGVWLICAGVAVTGGGIHSPLVFVLITNTIVTGLLLKKSISRMFLMITLVSTLVVAGYQELGGVLPQFFTFSPLYTWFYVMLGLVFVDQARDYVMGRLEQALAMEHRQNSARHAIEATLRVSEEKYRLVFNHAGDLIFIHDARGRLLAVNQLAVERLGYTSEELVTMTISDVAAPADRPEVPGLIERLMLQEFTTFEINYQCKDGQLVPVEISSRRITWDGNPAIMSICRDITERKRVEQELRASQAQTQAILDAIPDLMFEVDRDSRVFNYHAPRGEGFYVPPEVFLGKRASDLVPAPAGQVILDAIAEADRQGWHRGGTYALDNTSGLRWYELSMLAKDQDPGPDRRFVVLARDITERMQAQDAEREHRALAEALRDTAAAVTGTLKLQEVLDRVLENVGRVTQHDAANIMLLGVDGDTLSIACERGYKERGLTLGTPPPLSKMPILAQAARTGQPICIASTHTSPDWRILSERSWTLSYVTAPIRIRERTVGFLNLDSATAGFYQPGDAERLAAFAGQVAIAIENARLYEEVRKFAITDILTGVYNRTFFETEVARMDLSREFPLSIVVMDLDNMKVTNDRFGHAAGDRLLKRTAQVLQLAFRAADIIARIGGDEFAVLLPNTDAATVDQMLARIDQRLAEHNDQHPELPIQLSLGAATAVQGGLMDAFILADQRMYEDKARRKIHSVIPRPGPGSSPGGEA